MGSLGYAVERHFQQYFSYNAIVIAVIAITIVW